MIERFFRLSIGVALSFATAAYSENSSAQKAVKSTCSDIVALAGNVDINCSSLSPEQERILSKIPALLKEILAKQVDQNALKQEMDETLRLVQANANVEPIQIEASLYNPNNPGIQVTNNSERVADGITWSMVLFRQSDLGFFSFATQSIGYVKPLMKSATYELNLSNLPKFSDGQGPIKDGDDLTGSLSIDCPNCELHSYFVHFVWGQSGWICESIGIKGGYIMPKDTSKDGREKYIQMITNEMVTKERKSIEPVQR